MRSRSMKFDINNKAINLEDYHSTDFYDLLKKMDEEDSEVIINSQPDEFKFTPFIKKIPIVRRSGIILFINKVKNVTEFKLMVNIHPNQGGFLLNASWKVNTFEDLSIFVENVIAPLVLSGYLKHTQYVFKPDNVNDEWRQFNSEDLRGVLVELVQLAMENSMIQFEKDISDEEIYKICGEAE